MAIAADVHGITMGEAARAADAGAGHYGFLYPETLERSRASERDLKCLAAATVSGNGDQPHPGNLAAGYTFLGQFIAHDMSFDAATPQNGGPGPFKRTNRRTPRLDLDCLYGYGPRVQPYLYERSDAAKLLVGPTLGLDRKDRDNDLPRLPDGRAIIADPRNDDNLLTAQLHVAFARFHNAVVDLLRRNGDKGDAIQLFATARRLVVWHYQWIVEHDVLPKLVQGQVLENLRGKEAIAARRAARGFVPFEFSRAAFRLHTLVRSDYLVNHMSETFGLEALFGLSGWAQEQFRLDSRYIVDWRLFFFPVAHPLDGHTLQVSGRVDPWLAAPLGQVIDPTDPARTPMSLPLRTLRQGQKIGLPSGQAVARCLGLGARGILSPDEVDRGQDGSQLGLSDGAKRHTPLWYYVMREAECQADGAHLGLVGSHIVASTILGLLASDPNGYWTQDPDWTPDGLENSDFQYRGNGEFTINDLMRFDPELNPWATVWA